MSHPSKKSSSTEKTPARKSSLAGSMLGSIAKRLSLGSKASKKASALNGGEDDEDACDPITDSNYISVDDNIPYATMSISSRALAIASIDGERSFRRSSNMLPPGAAGGGGLISPVHSAQSPNLANAMGSPRSSNLAQFQPRQSSMNPAAALYVVEQRRFSGMPDAVAEYSRTMQQNELMQVTHAKTEPVVGDARLEPYRDMLREGALAKDVTDAMLYFGLNPADLFGDSYVPPSLAVVLPAAVVVEHPAEAPASTSLLPQKSRIDVRGEDGGGGAAWLHKAKVEALDGGGRKFGSGSTPQRAMLKVGALMEGTLLKKTKNSQWHARSFVLHARELRWTGDMKTFNKLDLAVPGTEVRDVPKGLKRFMFEIAVPGQAPLFLSAAGDVEKAAWIRKLKMSVKGDFTADETAAMSKPLVGKVRITELKAVVTPAAASSPDQFRQAASSNSPSRTLPKNIAFCFVCDDPVFHYEEVVVGKNKIHRRCWVCCYCGKTLSNYDFGIVEDEMYCRMHAEELMTSMIRVELDKQQSLHITKSSNVKPDAAAASLTKPLVIETMTVNAFPVQAAVAPSPVSVKSSPASFPPAVPRSRPSNLSDASFDLNPSSASGVSPRNAGGVNTFEFQTGGGSRSSSLDVSTFAPRPSSLDGSQRPMVPKSRPSMLTEMLIEMNPVAGSSNVKSSLESSVSVLAASPLHVLREGIAREDTAEAVATAATGAAAVLKKADDLMLPPRLDTSAQTMGTASAVHALVSPMASTQNTAVVSPITKTTTTNTTKPSQSNVSPVVASRETMKPYEASPIAANAAKFSFPVKAEVKAEASPIATSASKFSLPVKADAKTAASSVTASVSKFSLPVKAEAKTAASSVTASVSKFSLPVKAEAKTVASPITASLPKFSLPVKAEAKTAASPIAASVSKFSLPVKSEAKPKDPALAAVASSIPKALRASEGLAPASKPGSPRFSPSKHPPGSSSPKLGSSSPKIVHKSSSPKLSFIKAGKSSPKIGSGNVKAAAFALGGSLPQPGGMPPSLAARSMIPAEIDNSMALEKPMVPIGKRRQPSNRSLMIQQQMCPGSLGGDSNKTTSLNTFKLIADPSKPNEMVWMHASSVYEKDQWVSCLSAAIQALEMKKNVADALKKDKSALEAELKDFLGHNETTYSGFMEKLSVKSQRNWKRRWFELNAKGEIKYSADEKSKKAKRVIKILHAAVILDVDDERLNAPMVIDVEN